MALFPKLSAILGLNNVGKVIIPSNGSLTVDWMIPDFFTTLEHVNSIDSPSFQLQNLSMKVKLFHSSKRASKNLDKWFELCLLHADDLTSMTQLICKIGIRRNDGFAFKCIELNGESHGVYLLSISEFLRNRQDIAFDGYVTFFLEFRPHDEIIENISSAPSTPTTVSKELHSTSSDRIVHPGRSGLNTLSKNLKDQYIKGEHCDITIQVEDRQFKAHKFILSARSPVFSDMMHDMAETNKNSLEVTSCKPDTFHEFLLYLYSGTVDTLSDRNVIGLYIVSNEFSVNDLKADCVEYMESNMSVDLFCDIVKLASNQNESELLTLSKEYFTKNTRRILLSANWQIFLKENSPIANELFLLVVPDD